MTPYYQDSAVALYHGDAAAVLRGWPDEVVQTCITSPPYWGLRDYGTATWEGSEAGCDHRPPDEAGTTKKPSAGQREHAGRFSGLTCWKCGAHRIDAQLGLEPTPEEYVANLVAVFREVRRVLRDDGTLWLNLGDSYTGSGKGGNPDDGEQATNKGSQTIGVLYGKTGEMAREAALTNVSRRWTAENGMPPKNLVGIPWRVAFALQADGWYLRSDIIWAKPNPMPESVTDRPTKAHEYLLLLAKSARYFYDSGAIAEDAMPEHAGRYKYDFSGSEDGQDAAMPKGYTIHPEGPRTYSGKRNRRTVWEIATQPYPEAHFATFPPDLIKPCILAGAPVGGMVLDPFVGSGTTCYVAKELHRRAIGIDLKAEYLDLAAKRLRQEVLAL